MILIPDSGTRPLLSAVMLTAMIGVYPSFVQAQSRAAEQPPNEDERAPVFDAEPVFQRSLPAQPARTDSSTDSDASGTSPANAGSGTLPTRLPEQLTITDSNGNPAFTEIEITSEIRVVQHEWIMLIRTSQRDALENQAPELMEFLTGSQPFESIGSEILIFTVPPELDANDAILELVPADMRHLIDRNHIYSIEAEESAEPETDNEPPVEDSIRALLETPFSPVCEDPLGIGIIDSAIFSEHPAFADMQHRDTRIVARDFIDLSLEQPKGHGTAVAGLLAGKSEKLSPLLPGATLYSAGVVYSRDIFHEGATVANLLKALDWLMTQKVQVINMSLAGPPNRLLAQAIEATVNSGRFIVAAVGNEGPHAPEQFPAAYEFVISATAVDEERNIYRWANQGDYMDFAALGVSVPTTRGDGTVGRESGTSIAAPIVSAFLACALARHRGNVPAALNELKSGAVDLGEPGYDAVFGHGLLHP